MAVQKIVIPRFSISDIIVEDLAIFLDDKNSIILLPFLWAFHISNSGSVFKWMTKGVFRNPRSYGLKSKISTEKTFEVQSVSENTIKSYISHLFRFLCFINDLHIKSNTPSVHNTELVNSKILNHYLNQELPKTVKSTKTLTAHKSALVAYFSFLFELTIKDYTNAEVSRKTRQIVEDNDDRPKKINYISKSERSLLLSACPSMRDRLILRLGYEVGLRTCELRGVLLRKQDVKSSATKRGLINLFFELDHYPSKMNFDYLLDAKFSKNGKSRTIYFSRELLQSMKDYYENERLIIEKQSRTNSDTLLLRYDPQGYGLAIGKKQGTNLFIKLRRKFPQINQSLSYHDTRHTFATELYYAELLDHEGRETRSESAALLTVSIRLGHARPETSRIYIRLKQQMLLIEANERAEI